MPDHGEISDDHVTEMLKRDAKASSASASALNLGQLLNKRPTSSAPKPNTRFLRNILRDTDNHNAQLLAKEAEEARARLKRLRRSQRPEQQLYSARQRHDHDSHSARPRHDHDPHSVRPRHEAKKRRLDTHDSVQPSRRRHHPSPSPSRRRTSPSPHPASPDRHRHSKSRTPNTTHDDSRKRPRHHRRHSSSPHHRNHSPSPHRRRDKHREPLDRPRKRNRSEASDSDPLDDIIGPAPPPPEPQVRSRGRGTFNKSSTIDDHFNSTYDPTTDVQPDTRQDDSDDWEQALEALRDRQKWNQQGAERLRAAGFSEGEITKWEKGGEKSEQDVVWSKKGEGREWDRGKVVDDDGLVDVRPEWGRLKGT